MSGGGASVTADLDALREALAHVLACPRCEGRLDFNGAREEIWCASCSAVYPLRDGIPVLTPDRLVAQESERQFRDRLAADHAGSERAALLEMVAYHHSIPVMRRRAAAFASRFAEGDWLLDVGIGWGWHWLSHVGGARVLGIDMSLGNLRLARRMLAGETDRVVLVCADAATLPLRCGSVAGLWSVQTFQHFPPEVFRRAKREIERVAKADFIAEIYNLNPAWVLGLIYSLAGRRLYRRGRKGVMELNRLSAGALREAWRDFRPADNGLSVAYSELFFHPDLRIRPRRYPLRLEEWISTRAPWLARSIARQLHLGIVSGRSRADARR